MLNVLLIVAVVVLCVQNASLNKRLQGGRPFSTVEVSPEFIGQEADNMRRASENALRMKAETLLPRYEKSELVKELLGKLQEAMKYDDVLWDVEIDDTEVVVTTMTDAVEDRVVLVKEYYRYQAMGYEVPSRESCHRLALALALQKSLGSHYGINYQFRFNPADNTHTLSQLSISYRKKQEQGTPLKSPI